MAEYGYSLEERYLTEIYKGLRKLGTSFKKKLKREGYRLDTTKNTLIPMDVHIGEMILDEKGLSFFEEFCSYLSKNNFLFEMDGKQFSIDDFILKVRSGDISFTDEYDCQGMSFKYKGGRVKGYFCTETGIPYSISFSSLYLRRYKGDSGRGFIHEDTYKIYGVDVKEPDAFQELLSVYALNSDRYARITVDPIICYDPEVLGVLYLLKIRR